MINQKTLQYLLTLNEPLEPETIQALEIEPDSLDIQQVLVIKLLKDSSLPYEDFYIFENCVHTLNGIEADINRLEGSLPHHIWKCLEYMENLHPDFELSYEVKKYIEFMFRDRGYLFFPPSSGLENPPWYEEMVTLAKDETSYPLQGEDVKTIQAIKYLKIQEYIT